MATKNFYTVDSYDKLFCKCDGVTTTFVDSSTANPKTITVPVGSNATQLPIKFNKSAGFFNGTSDYLDIANSTDFAFGTGAFTIEGFFNTGIDATAQTILDTRTATANTTGLLVNIINSTGNKLCVTTATTARITGTTTLAKNTWYHFMVVGNGGANGARTIILYLDGVQEGSTYTNDYNFTDQTLRIGAIKAAAGTYMNGWMKELRISNVARTVAVPATQYTTDANTVLLMHFDTPATSPLGPAIAFEGTGDNLSLSHSDDWTPGTNFTAEYFVKFNTVQNTSLLSQDGGAGNRCFAVGYNSTTGGFRFFVSSDGTEFTSIAVYSITPIAGKWYHVAGVKEGNTLKIYIDGVLGATTFDYTGKTPFDSTATLLVGNTNIGSMREIRISNVARYTSSFTPSQTGFTVDANTKLYIKGNENNGVTTFLDSSTSPKTVTTAGNTKIKYTEDYRSCIFKDETGKFPYPVGSAKVDFFAIGQGCFYSTTGTSDYLSVDDSADWDFGTDPWTVEAYVRMPTNANCYIFYRSEASSGALYLGYNQPNGKIAIGTNSFNIVFVAWTPILGRWYHIAYEKNGGNLEIWIDGVLYYQQTDTHNFSGTQPIWVGYNVVGGRLDNIRISKGVARYTAAFNPPEWKLGSNQIMWII